MLKNRIIIAFILTSSFLHAQIVSFTDLAAWRTTVDAIGEVCYEEDFESFTVDTEFITAPLQLNGFKIEAVNPSLSNLWNNVDVPPVSFSTFANGTNVLTLIVNGDNNSEYIITFDEPVCGFYTEYLSQASGSLLMEVYNSAAGMIGSFTHEMNDTPRGIISTDLNMPITQINFKSAGVEGEGFSMDNIEIACCAPPVEAIPTMGQWAIICLSILFLVLGVTAINQGTWATA